MNIVPSVEPGRLSSPDVPDCWSELDLAGAEDWAVRSGLPAFRGRQLFDGLQKRSVQSFDELSDLPRSLRDSLASEKPIRSTREVICLRSPTDGTYKALLRLRDGSAVETVLIRSASGRRTVCVSSQVGCPAACSFCATGRQGFMRNLTAAEIVDQVHYFASRLARQDERVTNVVFMGMGEPLLNTRHVRAAIRILTDHAGLGLGERRITLSTVGIVPQMRGMANWLGQVNLAVSLHAPNNDLRTRLVPYNERFPIEDILAAVGDYSRRSRRRVSFEYVLLRGVNDGVATARELADLLHDLAPLAHVNVIPWNPFQNGGYSRSEGPDAESFVATVRSGGVPATIRHSKGLDINAACGQLRDRAGEGAAAEG